jgi:hypothetical protein
MLQEKEEEEEEGQWVPHRDYVVLGVGLVVAFILIVLVVIAG